MGRVGRRRSTFRRTSTAPRTRKWRRAARTVYLAWSDVQNGNYEIFFERSTDNGVTWTNPGATPTPTNTPTRTATNAPTATATATATAAYTWTPSATPTSVSTGSGVTKYYYFGSLRVAMNVGGTVYYLHADHLGSTSVVVNDTSTPVAQQSYFPYGGIRAATGTSPTDFTFTGQRFDASSSLMYYGARYYDLALGRFIQADSTAPDATNPQNLNRYSYVVNNPVRYTDPTGSKICGDDNDPDSCISPPPVNPNPTPTPSPGVGNPGDDGLPIYMPADDGEGEPGNDTCGHGNCRRDKNKEALYLVAQMEQTEAGVFPDKMQPDPFKVRCLDGEESH